NEGNVEQVGPPIELYEKPATQFVAGFLGSPAMNFLDATLNGNRLVLPGDVALELNDPQLPADAHNLDVVLGIRPEHMEACDEPEADFTLSVDMIEPLGADTLLYGKFPGSNTLITSEQPGKLEFKRGHRLALRIDRERCHLFDKATGKRVGS
ncbi:MAG: TOBE domain-containing protein, partial [Saccharospirillum sp.]